MLTEALLSAVAEAVFDHLQEADLVAIRAPDTIRRLSGSIRSPMRKPGMRRWFLLLRQARNLHTVIPDWQGNPQLESHRCDEVLRPIRCLPDTPKASFDEYPNDDRFDRQVEHAHQTRALPRRGGHR